MLNIKIIYILILCLFIHCSKDADYLFDSDYSMFNSSLNFEGDADTLDIITWNIENYPKDNSTNFFVYQIIDSLNVDIIALQEIKDQASLTNLTESLGNNWYSYRSGSSSSDWQELAFLINTSQVDIITTPYTILNDYDYEFAYREPLVLECSYDNQLLILINVHYKCCDGSEDRRLAASNLLYDYINNNHSTENVVVLGDFNDVLTDINNNVFISFLSDNDNYYFADSQIATSSNQNWSYPSWPSHIDHILITNELTDNIYNTQTILIDYSLNGSLLTYTNYISDHRPVGIKLFFNP
jgi:exonuclease III